MGKRSRLTALPGPKYSFCLATSVLLTLPLPAPAQAQSQVGFLEEVIVTARKREESLQDTPISIQAFSEQGLEQRGIDNVSQIGVFTPNMTFDRAAAIGGSNSSAVVYIRGIGQDSAIPTIDLGVGTYIDGVYLARSVGGVLDLVDAERIEVLRGPQGTLFGRNTIGGAINITSKKPQEEFAAEAEVMLGSDDLINGKLILNGPLTDSLLGKVAILSKNRDGYVDRPSGEDMGDEDTLAGSVNLRWLASDSVTIDLAYDATSSESNGAPFTLVGVNANAPFPQFYNAFIAPISSGCFIPPPAGMGSTENPNPDCYNSQWIPNSDDVDFGTLPAKDDLDVMGLSGTLHWQLSENLEFKSITSYRDTESDFALDQDNSPLTIAHVVSESEQDQFTQEFQLLGSHFDNRFQWIVGLYYFEEEGEFLEFVTFSPVDFVSGGSFDNDSYAAFAQGTFDITEKLSLTAGLRYTDDTKRFTPDQVIFSNNNDLVPPPLLGFGPGQVPPVPPPGTPILPNIEEEIGTDEVDPLVNLSYQWQENLMTYLSYSEGFKSGGFTQRVFPPQNNVPSFDPEYVKVYEGGFKFQSEDNRLRLNGAVFFSEYDDLQIVSQAETVAPLVLNAGEAEIYGFELDMLAAPSENLLIEAGVGYINAEYTKIDPFTGVGKNNSLVKTPEWSANAAISYTWDWGERGTFTPRVDYSFRDAYENNAINSSTISQDSFSLVNIGLFFESGDGKWEVAAMARNVTDEQYISAGYSEVNGSTINVGVSQVVLDRGREWTLRIKRLFF